MNYLERLKAEYDELTEFLSHHNGHHYLDKVQRRFEIVRELKDRTGKTHRELGEFLGLSHQRIEQMISGRKRKRDRE